MINAQKKILIIDDDQRHLMTASEILEEEGHQVITHNLAFGATNLIKHHKPDLVLLDINMPALSGDRLMSVMRDEIRGVPVVFYSSNDEDSLRRLVTECGADGYICKGSIIDLKNKVSRFLFSASKASVTVKLGADALL